MKIEETMSIDERRKYLHKMRIRYWQAKSKGEKSRLLDEMEAVTELHRKTLIRLINGELARKSRQKQRGRVYGIEVDDAVRVIARGLDYPCAERLCPNLVWVAEHLGRHGEIVVTPELLEKLGEISVSTLQRTMKRVMPRSERIAHRRAPHRLGKHIIKDIPMRRIAWDEVEPGHFEVDTVHHCGDETSGQYVHTVQMLDVATGWSECVAVLGRSYLVMEDGFEHIVHRLPFHIREIHPDNGSEFFNAHLLRFWKETVKDLEMSRSRPYKKNDNRFVEENNSSLVRAYLGYNRLDTVNQTLCLNKLYEKLWLYHNFFQPVLHLQEKLISPEHPARYKRVYDPAQTPFDRLCATQLLPLETQLLLHSLRDTTNPLQLRDEIALLIDQLFALPNAQLGMTEDVYLTIGLWK